MAAVFFFNMTACTASDDKDESNITFTASVVTIGGSNLGLSTNPAAVDKSEAVPILLFDSLQDLKDSESLLEQEFKYNGDGIPYEDIFGKYDSDFFKDKSLILAGFDTQAANPDTRRTLSWQFFIIFLLLLVCGSLLSSKA